MTENLLQGPGTSSSQFGRLGKPVSPHLNLLGNIAATTGIVDKSAFINKALREHAAATVRSNHEVFYSNSTASPSRKSFQAPSAILCNLTAQLPVWSTQKRRLHGPHIWATASKQTHHGIPNCGSHHTNHTLYYRAPKDAKRWK